MKRFLKSRVFLIFLAALTLVVVAISLIKSRNPPLPQIITSNPASQAKSVSVFDPITLAFDIPVLTSDFTVVSSPEEEWVIEQLSSNSISLAHKRFFHVNEPYTVQLMYQGQPLPPLTFTTKAEKNDPRYLQEVQAELDRDYPMSLKLPYETNAYKVVYGSPMTLEIRRKNSILTDQEMLEQVREWVRSVGYDPATHKYSVVTPTPTPSPDF